MNASKKIGIIMSVVVGSALMISPVLASAKNLVVVNNTKKAITLRINNTCSTEFGAIQPNGSKTVTDSALNSLCKSTASNCKALIFKSSNCTGDQVASFYFSTSTGLKSSYQSAKNYAITVNYPLNMLTLTSAQ